MAQNPTQKMDDVREFRIQNVPENTEKDVKVINDKMENKSDTKTVRKPTQGYDPNTSPQDERTTTRRKLSPLLRSES